MHKYRTSSSNQEFLFCFKVKKAIVDLVDIMAAFYKSKYFLPLALLALFLLALFMSGSMKKGAVIRMTNTQQANRQQRLENCRNECAKKTDVASCNARCV